MKNQVVLALVIITTVFDTAWSWDYYSRPEYNYNPQFEGYQLPLPMRQYKRGPETDNRYYIHQDPPRDMSASSSHTNTNLRASSSSSSNNDECKNKDPEANKRVGMGFYQDVWGNKQFNLVEKYLAEDVINHNPHEVNGRESVLEMLKGPMGDGPPVKVQFQRVSAEGDLVWIHCRLPIPAINKTYAIVDIFRIDCNGMIGEKWDVMQDTDVPTKNPVAFF